MFLGENANLSLLKHSEGMDINFKRMVKDPHPTADFQWKSQSPTSLPALPVCNAHLRVIACHMAVLFLSQEAWT